MDAEAYTARAHKLAFALSKRLSMEVTVRRLPLTKDARLLGFGFVCGSYYTIFGHHFLDDDLATFATRLMAEIRGEVDGQHRKGHASRKG